MTPKRFGNAVAAGDALAAKDSSHGRAIVTPAPRRTARLAIRRADGCVRSGISFTFLFVGIGDSLRQELRARDNRFDQSSHAEISLGQFRAHPVDQQLVRKYERAAERVHQQFPAEIVEEIFFAMRANVSLQALEAGSLASSRKLRSCID